MTNTSHDELTEMIENLVSWYDPVRNHNCKVPEVCSRGMYERVMSSITKHFNERFERAMGADPTRSRSKAAARAIWHEGEQQ